MDKPKGPLRSGFTTGACATAAAKGALMALVYQRGFSEAAIQLPGEKIVKFPLYTCSFTKTEGRASVIKDAGDDPDVTDKAEIQATVRWSATAGVTILGGPGVGTVTKPGLPVPPGEPAINPVPRAMIRAAVEEVLRETFTPSPAGGEGWGEEDKSPVRPPPHPRPLSPRGERGETLAPSPLGGEGWGEGPGVIVTIAVPRGEEMAQKTFNPRLGIIGGISILGTSGIVVPYSTSAWVASVLQAIDVAAAQGCRHLVLTVGGRSERAAQQWFNLPEVAFIQVGPFFGEALRHCQKSGIERVSLVAMIGKLAKFAAGHESVHSTVSSQDFEFLARLASEAGADPALQTSIITANTAQEVAELLEPCCPEFFGLLCDRGRQFAQSLIGQGPLMEVMLAGIHGNMLAASPKTG